MNTGSLAGEFINNEVLNILNATNLVYNTTFNVYSGLDNSRFDNLTTLNLENYRDEFNKSKNYWDDIVNNNYVSLTAFFILKDSTVQCIIGRYY